MLLPVRALTHCAASAVADDDITMDVASVCASAGVRPAEGVK
jgi:hypothetical protein